MGAPSPKKRKKGSGSYQQRRADFIGATQPTPPTPPTPPTKPTGLAAGQAAVDNMPHQQQLRRARNAGNTAGRVARIALPTVAVGSAGAYLLHRRNQAQKARAAQESVGKRYYADVDDVMTGFLDYTSDFPRNATVVRW